jgi:hypothetical protein
MGWTVPERKQDVAAELLGLTLLLCSQGPGSFLTRGLLTVCSILCWLGWRLGVQTRNCGHWGKYKEAKKKKQLLSSFRFHVLQIPECLFHDGRVGLTGTRRTRQELTDVFVTPKAALSLPFSILYKTMKC